MVPIEYVAGEASLRVSRNILEKRKKNLRSLPGIEPASTVI
jgi:hypothetical protein